MDKLQIKANSLSDTSIQIDNLSKSIRTKTIIDKLSATVAHGDVVALLGTNGAGKTSLIEAILGFTIPSEGSITFNGSEAATELSNSTKQEIGYVPQREELLEFLSVDAYLKSIASFYAHWNHGLVDALIAEWQLPKKQVISQLSIGQKQMVSILSAIGHEPKVLILDEPVSSLDPISRRKFLQALIDLQINNNTTVIFSTHIVSDVERVANRLWIMKNGKLVLDQSIDDLKDSSQLSLEDLFLEINQ